MSIFESYATHFGNDEAFDEKEIKSHWEPLLKSLEDAGLEKLQEEQNKIDWLFEDSGVTYNIYDKIEGNSSRSWTLDPIPFAITEMEWNDVKKGLQQRAKLLNFILKDIYWEQKLIKDNIVPAEVILTHKGYLTEMFDFGKHTNFQLYFYAADIARGPDGKMWIISDKTQAPSGLGYAIENRLAMNTIVQELYPNIEIKKLFPFIEQFKKLFQQFKTSKESIAVILSPGPHNETYFEHSYLSSILNANLVQGDDLLSKNGSLWFKSLGGLKKIDTILRRVDDDYCDPLELKEDSRLGVAGLVDSMRQDKINMINPIGSAILENRGLNPFMKQICRYFLKEELILPQIATWWCGQQKELDFVLEHFDKLIIKRVDKTTEDDTYFCKKLTRTQKEALKAMIIKNPLQYIAQEEISFSTVPFYQNQHISSRNAVIRTFCLKDGEQYTVMDGGFVRVSATKDDLLISSQQGATSKDLWILNQTSEKVQVPALFKYERYNDISINNVSSLKAENLFWLGRYLSRTIETIRFILYVIRNITTFYKYEEDAAKESQKILKIALTHITMTYPGFLDKKTGGLAQIDALKELTAVIKDFHKTGSLAFTINMLSNTTLTLQDMLSIESTKLFYRISREWNFFLNRHTNSYMHLAHELEKKLIDIIAYRSLIEESTYKEQGLLLYDIGCDIEKMLLLISKARSLLCIDMQQSVEYDILEVLLSSMESFNTYRAKYKGNLNRKHIIEFLVLDKQFPKSLHFISNDLLVKFKLLPKAKQEGYTSYELPMVEAQRILNTLDIETLMQKDENEIVNFQFDTILSQLSQLCIRCSDEFTKTYFSHYDE